MLLRGGNAIVHGNISEGLRIATTPDKDHVKDFAEAQHQFVYSTNAQIGEASFLMISKSLELGNVAFDAVIAKAVRLGDVAT